MSGLHAQTPREHPVSVMCVLLGVSKQAYYKFDGDRAMQYAAQEAFVLEYVRTVRGKDPGMGGTKLWRMYRREFGGNNPVGRDRFAAILDRHGLKLRKRLRAPRTTDSRHSLPTFPNMVREYLPTAPNRLWVSDITYIVVWVSENEYVFCYLSLILDAYTEEIVGWCVGETLSTEYPLEALGMAMRRLSPGDGGKLIHHSDRGVQYASRDYVDRLRAENISISMTEDGNPKDNAQAERVNSTMKNELLKDRVFHSVDEVREAVAAAVDFYNNERPHMSIDWMTPAEASVCSGRIEKKWRSFREEAITAQPPPPKARLPCRGTSLGLRPRSAPRQGNSQQNTVIPQ